MRSAMYGGLAVPITRNLMNLRDPSVEQFLQLLAEQGFFVDENRQEPLELEVSSSEYRYDKQRLSFWVQATTRCEERCPDCPYQEKPADMETGAAERLVGLIEERARELRLLEVTWFGGEPTLGWELVTQVNRRFADLAAAHGFRYRWSVITNGRSHHLKTILIHSDSPQRVWLNLSSMDSAEIDWHKTVLLADLPSWEEHGSRLSPRCRIRIVPGKPSLRLCRNLAGFCQRTPNFNDDEYESLKRLVEAGHILDNLPSACLVPCPAPDARAFIMDTSGNLYKCWNSFGQPQQGVPGLEDLLHPNFVRWLDWSPFRKYHCRQCNILPWCLGGCLDRPGDEDCGQWRYSLREILKLLSSAKEKGAA